MKKTTKIILLSAICLISFGLVLSLIGFMTGASFQKIYDEGLWNTFFHTKSVHEGTYNSENLYSVNAEDIENIDIDWVSGNVIIVPYDGKDIVIKEQSSEKIDKKHAMRYSVNNHTLSIGYSQKKIGILFGDDGEDLHKSVTIQVPSKLAKGLDELNIDTVSSDISILNLRVSTFDVDTTSGEIKAAGLSAREVNIDGISVDTDITFRKCPDSFEYDLTSGDARITVPGNSGISVEWDSSSGEFSSNAKCHHDNDGESFTIGDGHSKFDLSTISGDFNLRLHK